MRSGEPLISLLERRGWTYEDLIYENSNTKAWAGGSPRPLDEFRCHEKRVPVVSFFTGCGGMDLGLEAAGFRHVAAFEISETFCQTLRRNRPEWNVFGPPVHSGDVSKRDNMADTLSNLIRTPFNGLFAGGPPCQPFSVAANQRFAKSGGNFKRTGFRHKVNGNLLFDFIHLILNFRPRAFMIENVPGLRDVDGGKQLRSAIDDLSSNGYSVQTPFILDAARYGVPQQRSRIFIIGSRGRGKFKFPRPSSASYGAGSVLDQPSHDLRNNETREHRAESILRYMWLEYGKREKLGRVDRLDPVLPSKTVIAGGLSGGGRSHLHPEIPRTLSVRECARLQTFPDDYEFMGASGRQFTQVGNALPPVLAAQLGESVIESFF